MKRRRGQFFWKLFFGHAALLVLLVSTCLALTLNALDRFLSRTITEDLRARAAFLRSELAGRFDQPAASDLEASIRAAAGPDTRITLVRADGTVLADSEADAARMESHANRAEIAQALREGWGEAARWSSTVAREMKYVAARVGTEEEPIGVVRVARPLRGLVSGAQDARQLLWKVAGLVLAAACLLALLLAWIWSGPIARITTAARSLSGGDLSARVQISGNDEIAALGGALNRMRGNLARQVETIDRQRRTLENLLEQLHEGVVVVGPTGRIALLNPSAVRLLDLSSRTHDGRDLMGREARSVVPQEEVRRLLAPEAGTAPTQPALAVSREHASGIQEERLVVRRAGGLVSLLARASYIVLPWSTQESDGTAGEDGDLARPLAAGRLLVLTDITELTRTLEVKADFVANASHELRTPLAAIRGAVETLSSNEPPPDADTASRLMGMIDRHSERLEALVHDLLDLSRLESGAARFAPAVVPLAEMVREVHERHEERLRAKGLRWEEDLDSAHPQLWVNRELLRLVLDNLVDNAVKFTESGGRVRVSSLPVGEAMSLVVEDEGCGIPPEDHGRVFERFYQVERSRAGAYRGTGLGLAIVRHAVNAMQGSIELRSAVGKGTRITVKIPLPMIVDSPSNV